MKPSQELIDAMLLTARKLEADEYYFNPGRYGTCLIGCLVQSTSDFSVDEIDNYMEDDPDVGFYSSFPIKVCETTGIPVNDIYAHLYRLGIDSKEDLRDIEFAGTGRSFPGVTKDQAISYFKNKAEELKSNLRFYKS